MSFVARWFVARVNPVPWTVPNVAVRRGKGGGHYPQMYSAEALINYKEALKEEIERNYDDIELIEEGPVGLEFYFFRRVEQTKSKGKTKTGNYADATNLQKSTEDALQGLLFKNDSQVDFIQSWMMEQSMEAKPAVVIFIWQHPAPPLLPDEVREELAKEIAFGGDASENELDIDVEDIF